MLEVHYQQALSAPLPSIILKYIPGCHSPLAMIMFLLTTNIADAVAAACSQEGQLRKGNISPEREKRASTQKI